MSNIQNGGGGGGGSGTPGGSNTDIQFNSGGSFGGDGGLTYAGGGGVFTLTPAANTAQPLLITGGSTTGSGTSKLGPSVVGTLNTTGNVDGTAFFANITDTASGASSTLLDLQVGSSSVFAIDMAGNITLAGSSTISSATGLTIEQTGDTFGATAFSLQNRVGVNGAVFEQLGSVSVVDFVFLINGSGGFNGQGNIRYERRPGNFEFNNSVFEFQIGLPGQASFVIGDLQVGVPAGSAVASFALGSPLGSNVISQLDYYANSLVKSIRFETRVGDFLNSGNSWEFQFGTGAAASLALGNAIMVFPEVQFTTNTTGGGAALLGANCPAVTVAHPYTWITAQSSDGSTVYIPAWK
jgi:hypothetical protein